MEDIFNWPKYFEKTLMLSASAAVATLLIVFNILNFFQEQIKINVKTKT